MLQMEPGEDATVVTVENHSDSLQPLHRWHWVPRAAVALPPGLAFNACSAGTRFHHTRFNTCTHLCTRARAHMRTQTPHLPLGV